MQTAGDRANGYRSILDGIRLLDPVRDHQRIVFLSTCYEFPFDTTRALEFALFRTFAIPTIGQLLDRTGEFQNRAQKRYDDTDILVSQLMEYGYDSDRGRRALRRVNQLHSPFAISNSDYLYVLSTFIFEPIRWNAQFGWRPMCEVERLAMFYFWREVGRRMNIKDLPGDYAEFEHFNMNYEATRLTYSEASGRVGLATLTMFLSWFPRHLRPFVRITMYALMDRQLRDAFGFPHPSQLTTRLVRRALRFRGFLVSWLPERRQPRMRSVMRRRIYPNGYQIDELGPPREERRQ